MAIATDTTNPPAANVCREPDMLPPTYCLRTEGDCMVPLFESGTRLIVDRDASYKSGDVVAIFQRPDVVQPGHFQVLVKRLVLAPKHGFWHKRADWHRMPAVCAAMLNPVAWLHWRPEHILGIHKVIGIVRDDWGAGPVPPEAVIPIDGYLRDRMDAIAA